MPLAIPGGYAREYGGSGEPLVLVGEILAGAVAWRPRTLEKPVFFGGWDSDFGISILNYFLTEKKDTKVVLRIETVDTDHSLFQSLALFPAQVPGDLGIPLLLIM